MYLNLPKKINYNTDTVIKCSTDDVVYHFSNNDENKLNFRCLVDNYETNLRFYMCIFSDKYSSNIIEIIQIDILPKLRFEVHCNVGSNVIHKLNIPDNIELNNENDNTI